MKTALFVEARLIIGTAPPCAYCAREATYTVSTGADPEREPRCDFHTWSTLDIAAGSLNEQGRYKPLVARDPQS